MWNCEHYTMLWQPSVTMVLAFLVLISVCTASPLERIVGGAESVENKWPWQLSLQYRSSSSGSYSHICGAALLSENNAVTAAHCVNHDPVASKYRVVAGEHDFSTSSGRERNIAIASLHMHEQYIEGNGYPNDIAVLKFSSSVELSDYIKAANLPSSNSTSYYNGKECYISGWGRLQGGGSLPNKLQEAKTTVISHSHCQYNLSLAGLLYLRENPHICVFTGHNGACNGDSGGPLMCDVNDKWELAGVTSWGLANCPINAATVYTRISNYLNWISGVVQNTLKMK